MLTLNGHGRDRVIFMPGFEELLGEQASPPDRDHAPDRATLKKSRSCPRGEQFTGIG
jgi:hypothetical protein